MTPWSFVKMTSRRPGSDHRLVCLDTKVKVLVSFGLGDEEPSEYLEFEHHNSPALILYEPIVGAFSRIGDKFNLT
jgi:hypothetical protein